MNTAARTVVESGRREPSQSHQTSGANVRREIVELVAGPSSCRTADDISAENSFTFAERTVALRRGSAQQSQIEGH